MSTFLKVVCYLVALYAWWTLCSTYFEPEPVVKPYLAPLKPSVPLAEGIAHPSDEKHANADQVADELGLLDAKPVVVAAATTTTTTAASAAGAAAGAATTASAAATHRADPKCPNRRPYHTLLTAQGTIYNQWQARIMYFHWQKQRAADGPCSDMAAFTRLCPSKDGESDGVEKYIPTIFVAQLTPEVLAKYGHFGVLNRPHSVMEFFRNPELRARVTEEYVMLAETDHVLMKPLPNLASEGVAAAHAFGYMHAGSHHAKVIDLVNPQGDCTWRDLQPVGPSPLIIKLTDLEKLTPRWLNYSYELRADPMPARLIQDWVLEMWGYSIAAASLGVRHKIIDGFQIEPNAYARTSDDFNTKYYIFHYTYGIEYRLDGQPQGFNTIGEWSMDKRHYGGAYPPSDLDPPPLGANPSSRWLHNAWNSAINAAGATWPDTNAMGTIGWRRESISSSEISRSKLAKAVRGTEWLWSGIKSLIFNDAGAHRTTPLYGYMARMWQCLSDQCTRMRSCFSSCDRPGSRAPCSARRSPQDAVGRG